jgi:Tol biopolymer transport system component
VLLALIVFGAGGSSLKMSCQNMRVVLTTMLLGIAFSMFALSGCGDDDPTEAGGRIGPLEVTGIILSPKSPAPGDTVQLTAIVVSDTVNLEFPTYAWSSTGGIFLESDQLSVRWIAPLSSAIYEISITARNSAGSSSLSSAVFVGTAEQIIADEAGEMHVNSSGDQIVFLTSGLDPTDPLFRGFLVNRYMVGGGVTQVTTQYPGVNYVFTEDLNMAAHTIVTRLGGTVIENPIDVILDDLVTSSQTQITSDDMSPADVRHTQHTYPSFSPDNNLITFQVFRPFPVSGNVDTFDVAVYDRSSGQEINVTGTHGRRRRNFHPSFSSDGNWLVFISNRTGQLEWELYGLPVSGGTVATDSAAVVRLTDTGGTISSDLIPKRPLKAWNPNSSYPTIAIKDANSFLRVINVNSGSDVTVTLPAEAYVFEWSPDGEKLAISTRTDLYLLDHTGGVPGTVDLIVESEPSDAISGIAWSDDSEYLSFIVTRSGKMWYEVFDVGGMTGLNLSVIVTPSVSQGLFGSYSSIMNTRPQLAPKPLPDTGKLLYFLLFDKDTPRILNLDLSGALP